MNSEINNDEIKNITIRGVDLDIYDSFTSKLRDYNMNVGDAFNRMINDVLTNFDEVFNETSAYDFLREQRRLPKLSISEHQELVVTASDITATNSRIAFSRIDILKFDKSVTKQVFLKHVRQINRCTLVQFGKDFPKLLALSFCDNCENIEFTDDQ
jgi:hypothetical protein